MTSRWSSGAPRYVIMTAAHNEQALIGRTIKAVLSQRVLPVRWVIVSDRSSDGTDEIVKAFCAQHSFMRYVRLDENVGRGTMAKVNALVLAYEQMRDCEHDFVGNLDADVSFEESYFEQLMQHFEDNPNLGITGGLIYEKQGDEFRGRISNSMTSVAHAAQLMCRECYEDIGGYIGLEYGGEDWYAEIRARRMGWQVAASRELKVMHHRPTGAAGPVLQHRFREGKMDFSVGSHPIFELLKCMRRIPESPFAMGAAWRFAGFFWSYVQKRPRLISAELVRFLRREQVGRVAGLFGRSILPIMVGSRLRNF